MARRLDSCGGSGAWKSLGVYEDYRMMRDALSVFAPIRPIYFSICPFIGLSPAAFAKTAGESPSCCGCKAPPTCGFTKQGYKGKCSGAYTMTNFMEGESGPALNPAYPVRPNAEFRPASC